MSIEDTPLLQHHNPVFDLQDSPSHKKSEDSITMAEEGEHPNTKEPMNTQELLNTMVASQIQLREDMKPYGTTISEPEEWPRGEQDWP